MPNEDLVQEMTICHHPQHEKKDPGTCRMPYNPTLVARDFKEFSFPNFISSYIQFETNNPHCF